MEEGSQQPKIELFSHFMGIKKLKVKEKEELYPQLWTK